MLRKFASVMLPFWRNPPKTSSGLSPSQKVILRNIDRSLGIVADFRKLNGEIRFRIDRGLVVCSEVRVAEPEYYLRVLGG